MPTPDQILPERDWHSAGIQVYPSPAHHEESFIVGTPDALRALRDQIDKALGDMTVHHMAAMASDGESYSLVVVPLEESSFQSLEPVYSEFPDTSGTQSPWNFVKLSRDPTSHGPAYHRKDRAL